MDIKNLSITNFLTIGQAELQLDGRGLLLIQGENGDDTSAASNGAGKSSIVDALCWCLYGTTARDVEGDAVVNATAKKDCKVEVLLDDDGAEYRITRYRKDKVHKNQLYVHKQNATGGWDDLSKGTDKETQEVVRKVMGCSLDVFKGAIYAGQEAMPDLPGMTDKHLKLLIEEAAGVEELSEAFTEASKRALAAKKDFDAAGMHVKSLEQRLEALNESVTNAEAQHKLFEDGRRDRAKAELVKVKPISDGIAEANGKLAAYDVPKLVDRRRDLNAQLAGRKAEEKRLDELQAALTATTRAAAGARAAAEHQQATVKRQEQELADVESLVGKPCGECGKTYCEHDLDEAREARKRTIAASKEELLLLLKTLKTVNGERDKASAAVDTFRAGMTDVSAAAAELTKINDDLAQAQRYTNAIATLERDMKQVNVDARAKLTEPNPWDKVVAGKREDRQQCENDLGAAQDHAKKLEAVADLFADAAKVFGPAGVRAHILDTVTPFLNAQTTEYLGALADGNIHATWSTLAKTAKGDLKEKFNIEVENDKGGKTFKALSGGEKRKVRLAAAMALQDMVASRAEKPINLWIGDEIDHALDEPGQERLIGVLEKKAKERGTVLVISHNALTDWIDDVITVKKAGGVSIVSGSTHRGF
jgi:DNA repair exonuclease SbcCD ATPase subunit